MLALSLAVIITQQPDDDTNLRVKQTIGDVTVVVTKACIEKVDLLDVGREGRSQEPLLKVLLVIRNNSDTKKLHYEGWQREYAREKLAAIEDEFGNSYKRISFGALTKVPGRHETSTSIYPGEVTTELLVFEVPIGKAKTMKLRLPAESVEQKGNFEFTFPTTYTAPELKPKAKPTKKAEEPKPKAPPKTKAKESAAAEQIEDVELVRIVGTGDNARAMFRKLPSKKTASVRVGAKIGPYRVESIDADNGSVVVVDAEGKRRTLKTDN
jgi:Tfp pilus assembly protein PilP